MAHDVTAGRHARCSAETVSFGAITQSVEYRLGIALALGLLVGVERERRKGAGPRRAAAGIRTFGVVALLGGVAALGPTLLLAVAFAGVTALTVLGYARERESDPGATTEVALLVMFLVGALAMQDPRRATIIAVTVAVVLAVRERLHRFAREVLTERELEDGLMLAAAAFVVLPVLPDRPVGPFDALNPRTLWRLVVLVMAIGAAGHALSRAVGPRAGLAVTGLASGFVSSAAAIGAMGARAKADPAGQPAAVAGATMSVVSTFVQLAIVTFVTSIAAGRALLVPCAAAVAVAAGGALVLGRGALRKGGELRASGRAFEPKTAVAFAALVGLVWVVAAAVRARLGAPGIVLAAAVTGFVDAHAPAIAVAGLVSTGHLAPERAVVPILLAATTNGVSKVVIARSAAGAAFAKPVAIVVAASLAAAWAGALAGSLCG